MDVVAIGAHPDDIEIGSGGTIALHTERGDSVTFIILTGGGAVIDEEIRREEAKEAAAVLGVTDVRIIGFSDTEIPYNSEAIQAVEEILAEVNPDRVYIHSQEDTHQDHRKAALGAVAATRLHDMVLAYESPSTRSSFTPQYYIPFPKQILRRKLEAIRSHRSQKKKKYLEADAMEGLARYRGRQANVKYAESFHVVRAVERLETGIDRPDSEHRGKSIPDESRNRMDL